LPVQWADRDAEYVGHADFLSIKPTNFKNSDSIYIVMFVIGMTAITTV